MSPRADASIKDKGYNFNISSVSSGDGFNVLSVRTLYDRIGRSARMKKGWRDTKYILAVLLSVVISAFCFLGCDNGNCSVITSYMAIESEVKSSTADVVKAVADSVVEIQTESVTTQWGMQYIVSGAGSGVIVGHDSFSTYYIITNHHVISGARNITVSLRSGGKYDAELIASDVRGDIAVIAIKEESTLNVAVWGNSDSLQIGEDLIAIGNPLGSLGGTVTKGILSATERSIPVGNYTMTLLQTDTAINPGNSGGGLFNMYGQLMGVVNAKTSDEEVEGICFAIPANTARKIYNDLISYGVVQGRATLGISVAALTANTIYISELSGDIEYTDDNKFDVYDKIGEINGKTVSSTLDYNDAMAAIAPGDEDSVKVYRGAIQKTMFGGNSLVFSQTPETVIVKAKQLTKEGR